MEKKRPKNLMFLGIILIIIGCCFFVERTRALFFFHDFWSQTTSSFPLLHKLDEIMIITMLSFSILLSLMLVIGGAGTLLFMKWAKRLVQISLIIEIVFNFLIFSSELWQEKVILMNPRYIQQYLIVLLELLILLYLTRPKVKEQFK